MNSDPKVAFYLEHRELIEEWALLRAKTARAIASALDRASRADLLVEDGSMTKVGPADPRRKTLQYMPSGIPEKKAYVELLWKDKQLCIPGERAEWPVLSIVVDPHRASELREPVLQATTAAAAAFELELSDHAWWVFSRQLKPDPSDIDLDEYAADCIKGLRGLYEAVAEILVDTVIKYECGGREGADLN